MDICTTAYSDTPENHLGYHPGKIWNGVNERAPFLLQPFALRDICAGKDEVFGLAVAINKRHNRDIKIAVELFGRIYSDVNTDSFAATGASNGLAYLFLSFS